MGTASLAQDLSDIYGRGVHAYFGGQARAAHQYLTTAIDAGTRDPRAYYFRGLAYQQLGRPTEARADFKSGAELEQHDVGGLFYVDRSLERVQGPSRLLIEQYRAAARVGAAESVLIERNQRIVTAEAARSHVSAPGEQVLGEQPSELSGFTPANAAPPVRGEVEQPFNELAEPPARAPARPAEPNPLQEQPLNQAVPQRPATAPPANNAPGETSGAGTTRALGNALRRALGGFSLPEGLPLGGQGNAAPPAQPANDNPFDVPATPQKQ
jgi:hypothetical protein